MNNFLPFFSSFFNVVFSVDSQHCGSRGHASDDRPAGEKTKHLVHAREEPVLHRVFPVHEETHHV